MGTAYAVWGGIGAAGTVLVGIWWFGEPAGSIRMLLLLALIGCIVGLRLTAA
jgi:quaternary ammonium compound-resistance protein SugE